MVDAARGDEEIQALIAGNADGEGPAVSANGA
jgi:hypothetical protein